MTPVIAICLGPVTVERLPRVHQYTRYVDISIIPKQCFIGEAPQQCQAMVDVIDTTLRGGHTQGSIHFPTLTLPIVYSWKGGTNLTTPGPLVYFNYSLRCPISEDYHTLLCYHELRSSHPALYSSESFERPRVPSYNWPSIQYYTQAKEEQFLSLHNLPSPYYTPAKFVKV